MQLETLDLVHHESSNELRIVHNPVPVEIKRQEQVVDLVLLDSQVFELSKLFERCSEDSTHIKLVQVEHSVSVAIQLHEYLLEVEYLFVLQLQRDHVAYDLLKPRQQSLLPVVLVLLQPADDLCVNRDVPVFLLHQPLNPGVVESLEGREPLVRVPREQLGHQVFHLVGGSVEGGVVESEGPVEDPREGGLHRVCLEGKLPRYD